MGPLHISVALISIGTIDFNEINFTVKAMAPLQPMIYVPFEIKEVNDFRGVGSGLSLKILKISFGGINI